MSKVKSRQLFIVSIFFLLSALSFELSASSCCAQELYFGYKLSFYNLFSPQMYAFRRVHQFTLGCEGTYLPNPAVFNIEAQYNWIDEVNGKVSSHNLTAWVVNISGTSGGADTVKMQFRRFVNLVNPKLDNSCVSLEYQKIFTTGCDDLFARARVGAGFSGKFLPLYGANIQYQPSTNSAVNINLNWLEDGEDNPEFVLKLPISAGVEGRFRSQDTYLGWQPAGDGIGAEFVWDPLKSCLMTSAEGKKTHYWLKGYVGSKFQF